MKKKFKLFLVVFVISCVATAAGFAAGAQEQSAEAESEAVSEGPVEIMLWHSMSGLNGTALKGLADRFSSETPNINVESQFIGEYALAINKLKLAIQSKTHPEILQVYDIGTKTLLDANAIVPIQDLIDKYTSVKISLDDYVQQALNYYTFDGKISGLPFSQSSPLLYYNKDRFREVGLDPERAPRTYKEFLDYAAKLTDPASGGKKVGASWAIRSWLVEQQVALNNELFYNNENGRTDRATEVHFNQKAGVSFISMWSEMEKKGYYINPGRSWGDARNNFLSEVSALMLQSTSGLAKTIAGVGDKFDLGTAVLPRLEGAKGGVVISGNALWASKGHPDAETKAAFRFLSWIAEPEQQEEWHKATGYYPLRNVTIDRLQAAGYYKENPHYFTAISQLKESPINVATAGGVAGPFPDIRDRLEGAIEDILANDADVQATLDQAASEVNQLLVRYNSLFN